MTRPLPVVKLENLFPDIGKEPLHIQDYIYKSGNMPLPELAQLCRVVKHLQPKVLFEIGTFEGNTTLQMAINSDAVIYTLDLPPEGPRPVLDPEIDVYPEQPGRRFRDTPAAGRIHQLLGDSQTFDYSRWHGQADLVFVDACHHYDFVMKDTQNALKLLSPSGTILWHDYGPWAPGVMRALEEMGDSLHLVQIADTPLVLFTRDEQRTNRRFLERATQSASAALRELQARYDELLTRIEVSEASRQALIDGNKLLEASLADWEARHRELQTSCEAIEASRNALIEGNRLLEVSLNNWETRYRELQASSEANEASRNALIEGNRLLEASLADWQARYQELLSSHKEVAASRDALIEGNRLLEASLADWQTQCQELLAGQKEIEVSLNTLSEENEQLKSSLAEWQASYEELEANYKTQHPGVTPKARRVF